jgi:hypothetical protein
VETLAKFIAELVTELIGRIEFLIKLAGGMELITELPAEFFIEVEASLVVYCLDSSVN